MGGKKNTPPNIEMFLTLLNYKVLTDTAVTLWLFFRQELLCNKKALIAQRKQDGRQAKNVSSC